MLNSMKILIFIFVSLYTYMAKAKHKSFIFDLKENQSIFLLNQIFIFTSVSHHRILLSTNSN